MMQNIKDALCFLLLGAFSSIFHVIARNKSKLIINQSQNKAYYYFFFFLLNLFFSVDGSEN